MVIRRFIIAAEKEGVKKYVILDPVNGRSAATDDINLATVFPSKQFCKIAVKLVQSAIVKQKLDVALSVEEI